MALAGPAPVFAPLCLDPLSARLASDAGFAAGYLSGGALGFQYAVGEALLSYSEIADVARRITARSDLPLIIDGGVGFGDAVHTARATALFEATGAVAVEYEDQVAPKRLHHHIGVEHLVPRKGNGQQDTRRGRGSHRRQLPHHRQDGRLPPRGFRGRRRSPSDIPRCWPLTS